MNCCFIYCASDQWDALSCGDVLYSFCFARKPLHKHASPETIGWFNPIRGNVLLLITKLTLLWVVALPPPYPDLLFAPSWITASWIVVIVRERAYLASLWPLPEVQSRVCFGQSGGCLALGSAHSIDCGHRSVKCSEFGFVDLIWGDATEQARLCWWSLKWKAWTPDMSWLYLQWLHLNFHWSA